VAAAPPAGSTDFSGDRSRCGAGNSAAARQRPISAGLRMDTENSELVKLDQARKAAETDVIMKALYSTQWNRKRAAAVLGVDYKALLYKMKKLGIE
jgi:DNA-binding NtrC family response regulator